jgi:membrane protein YdbS with pleckstrin-like domain
MIRSLVPVRSAAIARAAEGAGQVARSIPTARFSATATATEAPPVGGETLVHASVAGVTLPAGTLDGGEVVLLAVKPSMWLPLIDALAWVVSGVIVSGAIIWTETPLPGLTVQISAQLALLAAALRLGIAVARWIPTWHLLTNRRVIDIRGIRRPQLTYTPLLHVAEVRHTAAPLERPLRLGTVAILPRSGDQPVQVWRCLSDSRQVQERIDRAVRDARSLRR